MRNLLQILPMFLLALIISCAQKTVKEKQTITIGYIIADDYTFIKMEDEIDRALRKSFLEKIPRIVRPVSFKFIPHSKVAEILEKESIDYKTANTKKIKEIADILGSIDIIILIKPVYVRIEDSYIDEDNLKCSYRKGFALMEIYVYRNDIKKLTHHDKIDAKSIKKVCNKEIFKSLDVYPKKEIRRELFYKIFNKLSDEVIKAI